jgi:hypothetical protein
MDCTLKSRILKAFSLLFIALAAALPAGAQIFGAPNRGTVQSASQYTLGCYPLAGSNKNIAGCLNIATDSSGDLLLSGTFVSAASFQANGTGAGAFSCVQGALPSDSSLPANGIALLTCPTSVTKWGAVWPGTGPSANSVPQFGTATGTPNMSTVTFIQLGPLATLSDLLVTNPQTATYQLLATDFSNYKTIPVSSGTFTVTVVASTSQPTTGQSVWIVNYGSGVVTIARSGQNLNGGTTSIAIPPGSQASPSAAWILSDGTNYVVQVFPSLAQGGVDSGSANAYVVTGGGFTQLATASGPFCFMGTHASSGASTVNWNGLGIKSIVKWNGAALATGDIGTAEPSCLTFDGTNFVLETPQATTGSGKVVLATSPSFNVSISAPSIVLTNMADSNTAPTISSGFGSTPSIASNNGSAAFTINVGTGGSATSGVIGLPAATNGWVVHCDDLTTQSATVFVTKQTASATNSATIGNFNTSGTAAAWAASDILHCTARGR